MTRRLPIRRSLEVEARSAEGRGARNFTLHLSPNPMQATTTWEKMDGPRTAFTWYKVYHRRSNSAQIRMDPVARLSKTLSTTLNGLIFLSDLFHTYRPALPFASSYDAR